MMPLDQLSQHLQGEVFYDEAMRRIYATDASMYREVPLAVTYPKDTQDLQRLIEFAHQHNTSLIPRTAGTSLAGQVVGKGIIVDVSKHLNQILEVNPAEKWVRVQPGVIRNDLNTFLKSYDLFFGPETATQNRAMIGGMVGNNSCGSNSIIYGSTRAHVLAIKGLLSDGSEVTFEQLDKVAFQQKSKLDNLEGKIYRKLTSLLLPKEVQERISQEYPKTTINRRNTGYAIDALIDMFPFNQEATHIDLTQLITGSEGTLMLITEIKLGLLPLPPEHKALVCIHCDSVDEALRANLEAVQHQPSASELIDHYVLECTKTNIEQQKNRFFIKGDPQAILAVELFDDTAEALDQKVNALVQALKNQSLGQHFAVVPKEAIAQVWALRNAGLGLLSNVPGDAKPVCVVEDTAVDVRELPVYIKEFNEILKKYDLYAVHYAHAGSGELHLRPLIDLKTKKGQQLFRTIAQETATLVKKFRGSLSGEHGDGRLRGEFIQQMIGKENYELLRQIKYTFDEAGIFNPNKIVDTPPMDTSLRYEANQTTPNFKTVFDFSKDLGILRLAEKCNGAGACRKTHITGGTMCPSYMATRNEKDSTRARANILREYLTHSHKPNRFDHEEIKEVMDLCLSCKGCKAECPSNVDVGKLKAEFLQQYYDANRVPFRTRLIASYSKSNKLAMWMPYLYNFIVTTPFTANLFKRIAGFATQRSLPTLHSKTLLKWYKKHQKKTRPTNSDRKVYLFCDEFSNYNDVEVGIKTIELLEKLGYEVVIPKHIESGRAHLSKGLLVEARKIAYKNIRYLRNLVSEATPIIGIEPSALLTLRDEYIDLVSKDYQPTAQKIADHAYLLEEFLAKEIEAGRITKEMFHNTQQRLLKVHGHCHQKALSSMVHTKKVLSFVPNFEMHLIPSGCCGMAGSFGYEKEHYEVSMQIGELVLFPAVRQQPEDVWIVASGTSCRHQIKDGTGRRAYHLAEVLWEVT